MNATDTTSAVRRLRAAVSTLVLMLLPAFAAAQEPVKPFQEMSASAEALRDSIVAMARAQVGSRYVLGGQSPKRGFDCSGLVKYVLAALNLDAPRTARQQARFGEAVPRDTSELLPGDLLTFGRRHDGVSHIGIYVGDGHIVHASIKAGRVIETTLARLSAGRKPWRGARRIVADVDTTTVLAARSPQGDR